MGTIFVSEYQANAWVDIGVTHSFAFEVLMERIGRVVEETKEVLEILLLSSANISAKKVSESYKNHCARWSVYDSIPLTETFHLRL